MLQSISTHLFRKTYTQIIERSFRASTAALTISLTSCAPTAPNGPVIAPTAHTRAVDQIGIDKNGCGPTSLMNAYRFGAPAWHKGYEKMGDKIDATDKQKFTDLVNRFGVHISEHNGMLRWDKRIGMSSLDLCDMANDFQRERRTNLPNLRVTSHYNPVGQADATLLHDVHKHLRNSMLKGFTPMMTIKRFTNRSLGGFKIWKQIHGHIVVLHEIPGTIAPDATSFQIKYVDPWGGRILTGTIKIPEQPYFAIDSTKLKHLKFTKSPALVVDFPDSKLGRNLLRKGERNATILAASIAP